MRYGQEVPWIPARMTTLANFIGADSYLTSSAHSDLVVLCNDDRYNVHKIILCSQSKWFATSCEGPTMVSLRRALVKDNLLTY